MMCVCVCVAPIGTRDAVQYRVAQKCVQIGVLLGQFSTSSMAIAKLPCMEGLYAIFERLESLQTVDGC